MTREDKLRLIKNSGVIAIVRSDQSQGVLQAVEAIRLGGIKAVEVTLNTPGALELVTTLRQKYQGSMLVGAGTVLDSQSCVNALMAGAEFIVSPGLNEEVIKTTLRYGKIVIPGALTPTEVISAYQAGAHAVKIFPAAQFGPSYIRQLKGPLNHIEMVPVGGINLENAAGFIKAGAFALGVGSSLVRPDLLKSASFSELTRITRQLLETVHKARLDGSQDS